MIKRMQSSLPSSRAGSVTGGLGPCKEGAGQQPSRQEDQGAEGNEARFQASRHVLQRCDISGTSIPLRVPLKGFCRLAQDGVGGLPLNCHQATLSLVCPLDNKDWPEPGGMMAVGNNPAPA